MLLISELGQSIWNFVSALIELFLVDDGTSILIDPWAQYQVIKKLKKIIALSFIICIKKKGD